MKKMIGLMLVAAMLCSLSACGGGQSSSKAPESSAAESSMTESSAPDSSAPESDTESQEDTSSETEESIDWASLPEAAFSVRINTRGFGQISYAEEDGTPEFDDEFPSQSAYIGLEGPETYHFAAKPDEGNKFLKWTKDGEDFSKDAEITVMLDADAEYIAVFGPKGTDETPVDLSTVTTLGEVLGLPDYGRSSGGNTYAYAFEQDGIIYRAVAEMPDDVNEAVFALDFADPEYDAKLNDLISGLSVVSIDNVSEGVPSQEELDALIGKTGQELVDDGWYLSGWNFEDMVFYMGHGAYSYIVEFEGEIKNMEDFADEDIGPMVVKSVIFDYISDPSYIED